MGVFNRGSDYVVNDLEDDELPVFVGKAHEVAEWLGMYQNHLYIRSRDRIPYKGRYLITKVEEQDEGD